MKVTIDQEFASLIPDVSEAHSKELEDAVLADGQFLNPLVVWKHKNILLDGHRRNKIHTKHPTLPMPKPVVMDFETRDEAHDWIIRHQLSKRNITDEQRRYLIGKLYLDKKLAPGKPSSKVETVSTLEEGKTAEKIALSEGVTERTVRNNADFAAAIDAVKSVAPTVASAVLSGDVKATTKDLNDLAELPKREAKKVDREIAAGDSTSVKAAVRKISGGIEFNPDEIEGKAEKLVKGAVDKRDIPIPTKLLPAFTDGPKSLRGFKNQIGSLLKAVEEAAESSPGCERLPLTEIRDNAKNLQAAIEASMPTYVCKCKGKGCDLCGNLGWLHKHCGVSWT